MSEGEQTLVDTSGDYMYVVKGGQTLDSPSWRSCRIVLTNKRLILATNGGKQAVPHARIQVSGPDEAPVPDAVDAGGATPLTIGDNVILVDAQNVDDFESEYCRATLHGEVILAKPQAVVGGVVQEDAGWQKARFRLDENRVVLGLPGNSKVSFPRGDVGTVETGEGTVQGEQRRVVEVEHTDEEGRSVETHFSGTDTHTRALQVLLESAIEERSGDYDLSETENQVLMALYSGVSPFEMSDFVGIDVDEVEEIYQTLLEVGAVDKVRERTEVSLNAQGRNMASEAMNEQ